MLGLILILFLGRWFSKMAFDHGRNRWAYAILGVVTYYAGTLIFGFLLGMIIAATGNESIFDDANTILLSLMAIPFGIGSTVVLYYSLRSHWRKNPIVDQTDLLDVTTTVKKDEF